MSGSRLLARTNQTCPTVTEITARWFLVLFRDGECRQRNRYLSVALGEKDHNLGVSVVKPMIGASVNDFETSHLIKGHYSNLCSDHMGRDTWPHD